MDLAILNDIGHSVARLKMYPYFDVANYILMSLAVREDTPQTGSSVFSRRHPFACWLATMIMCFAGSILGNFLIGESLLTPFKNHEDVALATCVWYFINYSPFDVVYRVARFMPIKLVICLLKEVQRTHKIHHGISVAYKLFPNAYLVCVIIGVVKGSGYTEMKIVERLIRGVWLPASNEFLKPSFTTKASVAVSCLFLLEKMGRIIAPPDQIYLGAVMFLIYFRVSSLLLGIHDPFVPFENVFCALFMGGLVDALKRAMERPKQVSANATPGSPMSTATTTGTSGSNSASPAKHASGSNASGTTGSGSGNRASTSLKNEGEDKKHN